MNCTAFEKLVFTIKSFLCIGLIISACGVMGGILFAPELSVDENGDARPYYVSLPAQVGQKLMSINWSELASLDNLERMAQSCAIVRSSPEGMFAIVTFHLFRKASRGESIAIGDINDEIRDTLPELPDFYNQG